MDERLIRTAPLNSGDDALVSAMTMLARLLAMHVEDGDSLIDDLRQGYSDLARLTSEGAVGRNVYIALAERLPTPSAGHG